MPSRSSSIFRRNWEGHPLLLRINQGVTELARSMKSIVDAKGRAVPSLGNSGKRHDSNGKKSSKWGGKREHSTKTVKEHWTHEDTVEWLGIVAHETVSKHELKMECDLKEVQKDERKVLARSPKKCIEEGSPAVKKWGIFLNAKIKSLNFKELFFAG